MGQFALIVHYEICSQNVHFYNSFWREQTLAATKLFLSSTRINFAIVISSRAVPVPYHFDSMALIRDLFSFSFPRKLHVGVYGSYDNWHYHLHNFFTIL